MATIVIALTVAACAPEFDCAKWAAAKGVEPADNPRGEMVDDAERVGLKPGATRVFVRDLLGEPDSRDSDCDFYELGLTPIWPPGQQYLIILYDERDLVTEVRVFEDN